MTAECEREVGRWFKEYAEEHCSGYLESYGWREVGGICTFTLTYRSFPVLHMAIHTLELEMMDKDMFIAKLRHLTMDLVKSYFFSEVKDADRQCA